MLHNINTAFMIALASAHAHKQISETSKELITTASTIVDELPLTPRRLSGSGDSSFFFSSSSPSSPSDGDKEEMKDRGGEGGKNLLSEMENEVSSKATTQSSSSSSTSSAKLLDENLTLFEMEEGSQKLKFERNDVIAQKEEKSHITHNVKYLGCTVDLNGTAMNILTWVVKYIVVILIGR
jgi:hypothetical protein